MEGVQLKRPTLLINWDEKLFEGLVARMRAKAAPSAGLPRENLQAKNKQSIPKVMFLCFVAIALESGDIRDGAVGREGGSGQPGHPAPALEPHGAGEQPGGHWAQRVLRSQGHDDHAIHRDRLPGKAST